MCDKSDNINDDDDDDDDDSLITDPFSSKSANSRAIINDSIESGSSSTLNISTPNSEDKIKVPSLESALLEQLSLDEDKSNVNATDKAKQMCVRSKTVDINKINMKPLGEALRDGVSITLQTTKKVYKCLSPKRRTFNRRSNKEARFNSCT